jgi:hypothetical protein
MSSIETVPPVIDAEEARRERNRKLERTGRWLLPLLIMTAAVFSWDRICVWNEIPQYILPRPGVVLNTLIEDAGLLFASLLVTLRITMLSLALAVVGGVGLSVLFTQSRLIEMSLFPFAIVLQVTPIVAIFPLINIYVDDQTTKLLLCAWIVAFFPILSNTTLGLNSVDRNLIDYFKLNGASRWQTLWHLQTAGCDAVFSRWAQDCRRSGADRRRGCRIRRRHRRPVFRPGLAHHRGRLPAQCAAAVRGPDPHLPDRHHHLPRPVMDFSPRAAPLARECAETGAMSDIT